MSVTLHAVLPVILLLVVGNILRRTDFLKAPFWSGVDKLIFYILFPCLLIVKIASVDLAQFRIGVLLGFLILFLLFLTILCYVSVRLLKLNKQQIGSAYQGIIRFNSYIYFAIIQALWGDAYLIIAALVAGIFVPMVNILSVLGYVGAKGNIRFPSMLISLIRNPFIIAAAIGFIINLYPFLIPKVALATLEILSHATLPLALLSVGAAVRISLFFGDQINYSLPAVLSLCAVRLFLVPLMALVLIMMFDFSLPMQQILIILAAVPTATSSHILARSMHGDADLMIAVVSLQTIVSVITLMLWVNVSYWWL